MHSVAVAATVPLLGTGTGIGLASQPQRRIGVALCGLGKLSTGQIAPALERSRLCRLAGVITGSPAKGAEWRARHGLSANSVYAYDEMERLADDPEIDVVYVVTPNALHLPHALAAARAGKHVLCEKPMEVSSDRCRRMIDGVRGAGRQLGVAYRCQFEPHHLECIRIARERELGALRFIEAGFGIDVGPAGQWRLDPALSGGGALVDVGIYALQATRYLTGEEPTRVSAVSARSGDPRFDRVDESVAWTANFPGGAIATCSTSYSVGGLTRFRATAERGWFELEPAFYYGGIAGRRSDGRPLAFPAVDQFAAELDAFAESLTGGPAFRASAEDGLRDVQIIEALYASIRDGRAVDIDLSRVG